MIPRQSDRRQPELRVLTIAADVHVHRFMAVEAVEKNQYGPGMSGMRGIQCGLRTSSALIVSAQRRALSRGALVLAGADGTSALLDRVGQHKAQAVQPSQAKVREHNPYVASGTTLRATWLRSASSGIDLSSNSP